MRPAHHQSPRPTTTDDHKTPASASGMSESKPVTTEPADYHERPENRMPGTWISRPNTPHATVNPAAVGEPASHSNGTDDKTRKTESSVPPAHQTGREPARAHADTYLNDQYNPPPPPFYHTIHYPPPHMPSSWSRPNSYAQYHPPHPNLGDFHNQQAYKPVYHRSPSSQYAHPHTSHSAKEPDPDCTHCFQKIACHKPDCDIRKHIDQLEATEAGRSPLDPNIDVSAKGQRSWEKVKCTCHCEEHINCNGLGTGKHTAPCSKKAEDSDKQPEKSKKEKKTEAKKDEEKKEEQKPEETKPEEQKPEENQDTTAAADSSLPEDENASPWPDAATNTAQQPVEATTGANGWGDTTNDTPQPGSNNDWDTKSKLNSPSGSIVAASVKSIKPTRSAFPPSSRRTSGTSDSSTSKLTLSIRPRRQVTNPSRLCVLFQALLPQPPRRRLRLLQDPLGPNRRHPDLHAGLFRHGGRAVRGLHVPLPQRREAG